MSNQKFGMMERVLAVVLSIVILVGVLPVMSFAADETDYTLTFFTGAGAPIEGVKVNYDVFRNGEEMYPGTVNATESDGVAVVDLSAVSTEFEGGDKIEITYTATKTGYAEVSDTIVVNALNGNTNVTMTQTAATIQVSVTGSGEYTVKLDGAETTSKTVNLGTQVKVEITPKAGSYVKTVSAGNAPATHGNTYTNTIAVNNDMMLNATVVKEYTLTATGFTATEGSVTFAANSKNVTKVDAGTSVNVAVTPNSGYQIESVKIGSAVQTVDDVTKFSTTITVDANVEVVATFVKVYTVTVNFGNNGTVTYNDNPVTTGGSTYVVKNGEKFSLKATPNANYRVSEVKVNNVSDTSVKGNNDEAYEVKDLTPTQNYYTYVITFAPNRFNVTASINDSKMGSVKINDQNSPVKVDYNGTATISCVPTNGYQVKDVTVDGISRYDDVDDNDTLEISGVTKDIAVAVVFEAIPMSDNSGKLHTEQYDITFSKDSQEVSALNDYTNKDGKRVLVFPAGTTATLTPTNSYVAICYNRVFDKKTSLYMKSKITLTETTDIDNILVWQKNAKNKENTSVNIRFFIDETKPTPTLTMPAGNGFYNSDVEIAWSAEDTGDYSGIQSVKYEIYKDGTATESGDLYTYQEGEAIYAKLSDTDIAKKIVVDSETFNSESVKVELIVTDRAGNEKSAAETFAINTVPPTAKVKFDNNTVVSEADSRGYYGATRTATVTITDRADTFDVSKVEFEIDAKDFAGNDVDAYTISGWSSEGNTHTATVAFNADANYTWNVFKYTNKAGLSVGWPNFGDSVTPLEFTVDTTDPTGTITTLENTWSKLIDVLTFGLFSKDTAKVTGTWEDATSPIASVEYYKTANEIALNETDLDAVTDWKPFTKAGLDVSSDEQFTVYLKITDAAGNYSYISTDGVIVDNTKGAIGFKIPTDFNEGQNGFYTSDVEVAVTVEDASNDGVYSGLNKITYEVFNGKELTQSGTLFTFNKENPTKDDLVQKWASARTPNFPCITVDKEKNNSDDVRVVVTAVDNAGNEFKDELPLMINATTPTAKVEFDNNNVVSEEDNRGYYGATRTATITISDRESTFDPSAVNFTITAKDGEENDVANAYTISDWSLEGDAHTATVAFNADANYNWKFEYENKAGLALSNIVTDENKTPFTFTVDQTAPTGTITTMENTWSKLIDVLTFGLFSQDKVDVTGTWEDVTSPVASVEYYKVADTTAKTASELDSVKEWADFASGITVPANEQFTVYLKLTDAAGNYTYISTNGVIVDDVACAITLTPDTPTLDNGNDKVYGYYNKDVNVEVEVLDPATYSGIKTVSYKVVKDGDIANAKVVPLFTFDQTNPTQENLVGSWKGNIEVKSAEYNSSDVVVYVTVEDNAGNVSESSCALDIDVTAPKISLSYENVEGDKDECNVFGEREYYDHQRIATIKIQERTNHFDANAVQFTITAKDVTGNDLANADTENAYEIGGWNTTEGATPDEYIHTVTVTYSADANYTFAVQYTDKAGNEANPVTDEFAVDTTAPTASVTAKSKEGREVTWDALANSLTFGFWSQKGITVTGEWNDVTSPVASMEYYKTADTTALKAADLDAVTDWKSFKGFDVSSDEQFTVYLKITDAAGNVIYVSTDGLIVDETKPMEQIAPEVSVKPEKPINGIYKGDVKVDINVTDPLAGGTYSGLNKITYEVYNMGELTQDGELFAFDKENPTQKELLQEWDGSIVVDSALNNSNDVKIKVTAWDNADNTSFSTETIKIDVTAPVINVSYNNNNVDSGKYYKADRIATVVVTERNFDPKDVKVTITNTHGVVPTISAFTMTAGNGNGDDTAWTATIPYTADGDYTFAIVYTDKAGNTCNTVNYVGKNRNAFTIDKTNPTVAVSYDNNSAQNGNYYKASRTATIVIKEHNFSAERVNVSIKATNDGASRAVPNVSAWRSEGDTHVATISYVNDAKYTFNIDYTDLAGNKTSDFKEQTFYVDKTKPTLEFRSVEENKPYPDVIQPVVALMDTNFDMNRVTIRLSGANRKNVELLGSYANVHNGRQFVFADFAHEQEIDDIYTLSASLTDKAGNTTEKTITFSVNRFGSVYSLSESASKLNGTYVKEPQDVVFTETNANAVKNVKMTLFKNDQTIVLEEGKDYSVSLVGGGNTWYQYTYTVFADVFKDDGVYKLTVHSEDAAGNVAENTLDTKKTAINFGVDSTKPTITVANLDNDKTYAVESLNVVLSANDNLMLRDIQVFLDDYDTAYRSWGEEEIAGILAKNSGFSFDVSGESTKAHKVKIVCTDAAGNVTVEEITNFYVTTDMFVRYFNNKPLFFGSIGGVVAAAGLIVFLIVKKRKKDDDEEAA